MHTPLMYAIATVLGVAVWYHEPDSGTTSVQTGRLTSRTTTSRATANLIPVPKASARPTNPTPVPSSLPFVRLHNGDNSGFTRNSEFVIQDPDEFTRRWRGVQQGAPDAALPEVDFAKTTVVLVAIGIRNTGGHAVRVDSVTAGSGPKEPSGATVHYTVTSPGARCMSMQMLTSPIEVISIDRVMGAIKFKKRGVSGGC